MIFANLLSHSKEKQVSKAYEASQLICRDNDKNKYESIASVKTIRYLQHQEINKSTVYTQSHHGGFQ